jgi:IS5 family transposase
MSTFGTFILHQEYAAIAARGDPINEIHDLIDWELFRPRLSTLYASDRDQGGRPHTDVIVLMKLLVLQQWYGLSDYELERQAGDRISFRHFLGYPATIPDRSTIWVFKNRLVDGGMIDGLWSDLQQHLDARGLTIRRGVIQDATFITADPGHAKADTPRGDQARTRRSRDGTWAKKGTKNHFGYKLHTLVDKEFQLIRRIATTTASLHDSRIDLSQPGETVYRDKGYFGVKPAASMDKTLHRAVRNHPLSLKEKRRNRAISRTRALVERPYAVIKRYFHAGHVMVTTVARVHLATMVACFCYNLLQLRTIHHMTSLER